MNVSISFDKKAATYKIRARKSLIAGVEEVGGFSHRGNASWDRLGPKHVQVINSCLGTFNKAFLKLFLYWFCALRQLFWCHVLAKGIVW